MSEKRKVLTLEERVAVIRKIDCGKSCCSVAEETGVGKTQIQGLVKDKETILKRWKDGERSDKKYSDVNNTNTACVSDEESGDDEPTNELKVREAANYLYELRNAITQEKPDLLHLITESRCS